MKGSVPSVKPLGERGCLDVFDIRERLVDDYNSFTTASVVVRDPRIKQHVTEKLMPRYWVPESEVDSKLEGYAPSESMLGYRWISATTNERTFIVSSFPRSGLGNSLPLILGTGNRNFLQAAGSSLVLDYVARQMLGGSNMTFGTVNQLPIPAPSFNVSWIHLESWVTQRVERLNRRDKVQREAIRAELDAAMFHFYGISSDDADYILETFLIVKRKEIAVHEEFRTKRLILEFYDVMAAAIEEGRPYNSPIDLEVSQ